MRSTPRFLALLLLPVLLNEQAGAAPRPRLSAGVALRLIPEPPIAYLQHIDPVALRFQPKARPPAPWPEVSPAEPALVGEINGNEQSGAGPANLTGQEVPAATSTAPESVPVTPVPENEVAAPSEPVSPESNSAQAPVRSPSPILVDELRPTIRPEDFLPYFILPGSGAGEAGTALIVPVPPQPPAPAPQPPSSARFIQTP